MKPRRSILSVPANVEKFHKKAIESYADVIMFDLEDSIPVEKKLEAREVLVKTISNIETEKIISIRINPVNSQFIIDDLMILSEIYNKIDSIVIPKVENVAELNFVDRFLNSMKLKFNYKNEVGIEASIETVKGMENISEIASSSKALISLVFGVADFTASLGASLVSISGHGENEEKIYPGHRWHYALSKIAIAAKANDLIAIDAPYGNFKDQEGLIRSSQISRALGIDAKWAIHPDQIDPINQIFSPTKEEIIFAERIISAAKEAIEKGKGSIQLDGKMIDQATFLQKHEFFQLILKLLDLSFFHLIELSLFPFLLLL
jgi:citrate lyase subunit beta/citryl-CoA lyase/malyl-CoA/(S)-citramalyl-CoA lyase